MSERELDLELRREKLRDLQSQRRAREHEEAFSLFERAVILLFVVVWLFYALSHYPHAPPISALGSVVGGGFALMYRRKR